MSTSVDPFSPVVISITTFQHCRDILSRLESLTVKSKLLSVHRQAFVSVFFLPSGTDPAFWFWSTASGCDPTSIRFWPHLFHLDIVSDVPLFTEFVTKFQLNAPLHFPPSFCRFARLPSTPVRRVSGAGLVQIYCMRCVLGNHT